MDGLAVDGLAVDGLAVDGLAVDGLAVDGLAVDGASPHPATQKSTTSAAGACFIEVNTTLGNALAVSGMWFTPIVSN